MKKSTIFEIASIASFGIGFVYALGIEGNAQIGNGITTMQVVTAMAFLLAALAFMRVSFAIQDYEEAKHRQRKKIHKQPKHTVRSSRYAG